MMYNDTIVTVKREGNLHITLEAMLEPLPYFKLMWPLRFSFLLTNM